MCVHVASRRTSLGGGGHPAGHPGAGSGWQACHADCGHVHQPAAAAATTAGLRHLASMPELRSLDMARCSGLRDEALAALAQLPALQTLNLQVRLDQDHPWRSLCLCFYCLYRALPCGTRCAACARGWLGC